MYEAGYEITLHCYQYGRKRRKELEAYCHKVNYYPRSAGKSNLFGRKPYIVASRHSDELVARLIKDRNPILFEGLHCTSFLDSSAFDNRVKLVRSHNIEHDYYQKLAEVENNIFKRYYFYNEASKLKRHEKVLKHASNVLAISPADHEYLLKKYKNSVLLPAFHSYSDVKIKSGKGAFILYHGNLAVGENNEAACYLVKNVFSKLKHPCLISGTKPSSELKDLVAQVNNVKLESDLDTAGIHELIANAQINVLPTFQSTGIKLKLLAALFGGRHCVVNTPMVKKTGLEDLCHLANKPEEFIDNINELWEQPFSYSDIEARREVLLSGFSNEENVKTLKPLFA